MRLRERDRVSTTFIEPRGAAMFQRVHAQTRADPWHFVCIFSTLEPEDLNCGLLSVNAPVL